MAQGLPNLVGPGMAISALVCLCVTPGGLPAWRLPTARQSWRISCLQQVCDQAANPCRARHATTAIRCDDGMRQAAPVAFVSRIQHASFRRIAGVGSLYGP